MLLFVYGTLMRQFRNCAADALHRRGEFAGTATIRGKIVMGSFPELVSGPGRVAGELFRTTPQLLRYLDAYEGDGYRRRLTVARLENGAKVRAFAYYRQYPSL